jgi:hypothetical protein
MAMTRTRIADMPKYPLLHASIIAALAIALSRTAPAPAAPGVLASSWPLVQTLPHPAQWVVIDEVGPYTVPDGATFVVTGVGTAGQGISNSPATAFANGTELVKSIAGQAAFGPCSVVGLDAPLAVPAGTVLSVVANSGVNNGRLWGYLVRTNDPESSTFVIPPPWEWITLQEGTPYQVPAGKLLVMTAINFAMGGTVSSCHLLIDGQRELNAYPVSGWNANVRALPVGLAVQAGSLVEPHAQEGAPPGGGRAWGFLVDAR